MNFGKDGTKTTSEVAKATSEVLLLQLRLWLCCLLKPASFFRIFQVSRKTVVTASTQKRCPYLRILERDQELTHEEGRSEYCLHAKRLRPQGDAGQYGETMTENFAPDSGRPSTHVLSLPLT